MSFFFVNNLTVGYGKHTILENLSFQMDNGCLMGILGANGSGKTTLLKAMCGILPHQGTCTLDSATLENLSPKQLAKLVSYIPQQSGITIDISVLDVVIMGFNPYLNLFQRPTASMNKVALDTLAAVGLAGKEHLNYQHLSQGQKQLCILARTMVSDSKLLFLDEPESALDFSYRYRMLSILRSRISTGRCSAIVTLHDPYLALNFCDRLLLLTDGKIESIDNPKTYPLDQMATMLSTLYGNVSLQLGYTRNGDPKIIMLKEDEL